VLRSVIGLRFNQLSSCAHEELVMTSGVPETIRIYRQVQFPRLVRLTLTL